MRLDSTARPRRFRRMPAIVLLAAVLLFAGRVAWLLRPVTKDLPESLTYPQAPSGTNGLSAEERQQYYHLTEGGELFPMAWLLALEQPLTDAAGTTTYRPFLDNVQRFGMIPDPPSRFNPYGLPVGVMPFTLSAVHVGRPTIIGHSACA